ncbi:MAG: M43 family zinc metalloprotease [Bacteroidia bacterium]
MKKIYLSLLFAGLFGSAIPVNSNAQQTDWCLTETLFQQKAKQDPSLLKIRDQVELETQKYVAQHAVQKTTMVPKIIPVVFHVIHEGGPENISTAQILDQLDSLNKDFRRLNADTVDTPAPFKPLAADCNIEFRLAQLDPNGNCTDGITRQFSLLTTNANDNIKVFDYWPSNEYLNIWIVKSIYFPPTTFFCGGYAQFPGGNSLTDGIVMCGYYVGSIGTAAGNGYNGRIATHEIGHWLNLRHIWGDVPCGNDFVADTPIQNESNACPNFPKIDTACNNGPNGAMFTDYMDYTWGECTNMFSEGQRLRMEAALNSTTSGRNNLWSAANLTATGTDGTPPVLCAPVADFLSEIKFICEGTTLDYNDGSTNGVVTSWDWQFPGGTPSSSTSQNVSVQYNLPGTYDVILTATNAAGSSTKTAAGMVVVSPAQGISAVPFNEGFESIIIPGNDWYVLNDAGTTWEETSVAAHTGFTSMRIFNYTGNPSGTYDNLITTSFDLSNVSNTQMYFWRAFAYRSNTTTDALKIYASTSCGQLWNLRYTKTGTALSTAGLVTSNFTPIGSQWSQDNVNLAPSSVSGHANVRFKFEYKQDSGNNLYLDDIILSGTVGLNEINALHANFEVFPNPAHAKAHISFSLTEKNNVQLKIYDVAGREVKTMVEKSLSAGEYQYDVESTIDNGIYFISLTIGDSQSVKKLVLNTANGID